MKGDCRGFQPGTTLRDMRRKNTHYPGNEISAITTRIPQTWFTCSVVCQSRYVAEGFLLNG